MEYVWFSLSFFLIHLGAHVIPGMLSLHFSRDLYTGEGAVLTAFLRTSTSLMSGGVRVW